MNRNGTILGRLLFNSRYGIPDSVKKENMEKIKEKILEAKKRVSELDGTL